jgi:hypothetical protein
MHWIIHCVGVYGGTFSGKKSLLCVPVVELVGHICSFEGCIPDPKHIKVILDWQTPTSVTEVCSFLGTAGVMRVFMKGFASIACPLVKLTEKDATFEWFKDPHQILMDTLKDCFANSAALCPIDYICGRIVYLSINSSYIAVGYILSQLGEDGCHYLARFGSIPWNKTEANYSQPKIELYSLAASVLATPLLARLPYHNSALLGQAWVDELLFSTAQSSIHTSSTCLEHWMVCMLKHVLLRWRLLWRNRKGTISQNCLAACDFNMMFLYILSGWDGSANNATMYHDACTSTFAVPLGRQYLADTCFGACAKLLVPYRLTRYHLAEWGRSSIW